MQNIPCGVLSLMKINKKLMCFPHGMAVLIKKNSFYFRSPLPMTFLSMPTPEDPMLKCPELRMNLTYDFLEHTSLWGSDAEVPRVEDESYLWLSWACWPLRIPCWSAQSWEWILPMTFLSMPAPEDPMLKRPELRMFIATLNPPPTSPMTFSKGTGVLSKNTSHAKISTNITSWRNVTG